MDLYEIHISHQSHAVKLGLLDIPWIYRVNRQSHGEQRICISAKHFPVEEVPPSAYNLSENQSIDPAVPDLIRRQLFKPAVYKQRRKRGDHRAVDGQTAPPEIEDAQKVIFVLIPGKDHVIDPCPDHGKNDCINAKIPYNVCVHSLRFCHALRHQHAKYDTDTDDHAVKSDLKSKHRKTFRQILQIDPKMRESDILYSHCIRHIFYLPYSNNHTLNRNRITSPSFTT